MPQIQRLDLLRIPATTFSHGCGRCAVTLVVLSVLSTIAGNFLAISSSSLQAASQTALVQRNSGRQSTDVLGQLTSWTGVGVHLKSQLTQLSQQTGLTILLDRRIDPEQTFTVNVKSASRAEVLFQLAARTQNGGWCRTDDLVYFGSHESAGRLPVLLATSRQLMSNLRKVAMTDRSGAAGRDTGKMSLPVQVRWARLAEPRQILIVAAQQAGVTISNPDEIPHDLWDEAVLRPMTFFELSALILNQFDRMLIADGILTVKVVPLDEKLALNSRYEIGRESRDQVASALQSQFPELAITVRGSVVQVSGILSDHAAVHQYLLRRQFAEAPSTFTESLQTRPFTFRAERATLGQLIEYFRTENIRIEISGESSPEVQSVLNSVADVGGLKDKLPGSQFFPQLFGKYFRSVEVQPDRVVLSIE